MIGYSGDKSWVNTPKKKGKHPHHSECFLSLMLS